MVLRHNSSHVAKSSNLYNVQDADFDNWVESNAISVEKQNGSFLLACFLVGQRPISRSILFKVFDFDRHLECIFLKGGGL